MIQRKTLTLQGMGLLAVSAILAFSSPVFAKSTLNPVDLISDGGYTIFQGSSTTTRLFVDRNSKGRVTHFWVRVEENPGIRFYNEIELADQQQAGSAPLTTSDQLSGERLRYFPPVTPRKNVYVKYFPMNRYYQVMRALSGIRNFGTVNPYVDDFVICDAPNSTIRVWGRSVFLAYNCGSNGPDADAATFTSEDLINALRKETTAMPDMKGTAPQ